MANRYDIAVLGAGPGGYIAALEAARRGASVAVVEASHLGGTCLNNGCIPSKALLAPAELLHRLRAGLPGVQVEGVTGDWPAAQKHKDRVVGSLRRGVGTLLRQRGVDVVEGRGALTAPDNLAVKLNDGGAEEVSADRVLLAPGSVPARVPGWPDDPAVVCSSDEALHWDALPARLLIVGGGYIGCEFASMLHAFGVQVTLVEMLPSLLPGLDADLGSAMTDSFNARGIDVHVETKVESLHADSDAAAATLSSGATVEIDRVLVSIGRRPNTDGLGLEAVGVATDRGFVTVDDTMRTSVPGVWCIGDANGRMMLAHAASAQGVVAVRTALGEDRVQNKPVPGCVFTVPEVGTVGMTEAEARQAGLPIAVGRFPLGHLGKALAVSESEGFVKVLRHRQTDALLGVHVVGHSATEVVASAAVAMAGGMTASELAGAIFAHPTMGEGLKEGVADSLSAALHLPPRKLLRMMADAG